MAYSSTELWERALQDEPISSSDIENMLRARINEDLWLDWKGGKIVEARNTAAVQKAVAGFANAEGGILVLGVNGGDAGKGETPWTLAPCPPKAGKQSLREWVEQSLVPLRSSLRPLPRIIVLDPGLVLIAVQRSEILVPVVVAEKGPTYFLRFYGSTQVVPGYLLADLVLGRRQRPRLDVRIATATVGRRVQDGQLLSETRRRQLARERKEPWSVSVSLEIHNSGLVWAEGLRSGIVLHGAVVDVDSRGRPAKGPEQRIPPSIRASITGHHVDAFHLEHRVLDRQGDLAPFDTMRLDGITGFTPSIEDAATRRNQESSDWWQRKHPGKGRPVTFEHSDWRVHWKAPLYILARNAPPSWYQIDLVFDERQVFLPDESSVEPAEDLPIVDIQVSYRRFDGEAGWVDAMGWGDDPLAPRP